MEPELTGACAGAIWRAARRGRVSTSRCWSPTGITGTRAGPSRRTRATTSSPARRSTSTTTASRKSSVTRRVLVLGIGNSATDLAVELAHRGRHLPRRCGAVPGSSPSTSRAGPRTELATELVTRLPLSVQRAFYKRILKTAAGHLTDYGLPSPTTSSGGAPTILGRLLPASATAHHREAEHRGVRRRAPIRSRTVRPRRSTDRHAAPATRSRSRSSIRPTCRPDNRIPLYRRVVHPDLPRLYFIGLVQPLGAIMPIAEPQSEWVADLLEGRAELPEREPDATGDRARGPADGETLHGVEAAHDPGRLPPVPEDAAAGASPGAARAVPGVPVARAALVVR